MGLVIGLGGNSSVSTGGGMIQDMEGVTWTGTARISDKTIMEFPGADFRDCTSLYSFFNGCKSLVSVGGLKNTGKVTSTSYMFFGCSQLQSVQAFDTANVTDMGSMFKDCKALQSLPAFDTAKVSNMDSMFSNTGITKLPKLYFPACYIFTSAFDSTKIEEIECIQFRDYVSSSRSMFRFCSSLKVIHDLKMDRIADVRGMFDYCTNLHTIGGILNLGGCESSYQHNTLFTNCFKLENVKLSGVKYSIDLSYCKVLSVDSVLYLFNNAQSGVSGKTIQLNSLVFDQLTEDQIAIATEKGFSVTSVVRS